jgi:proteasome lid subunit RPN8/RPN11
LTLLQTGADVTFISSAVLASMRAHAEQTYPHECCGALLAIDGVIADALPLTNTTEGPAARRFLVGPADYRRSEAWAAGHRGTLAGFYHSHPDHPARPSEHDLEHAWPTFLYVIVSVIKGSATALTGWRLRADRSGFDSGALQPWHTES